MLKFNLNKSNILSMSALADIVLAKIQHSFSKNELPSGDNSNYLTGGRSRGEYKRRKARGRAAYNQESTHTANVNMILTGGLRKSLRKDKIMETKAVLKYGDSYLDAIKYNEDTGNRSVRTLSPNNIEIVEKEFAKDVEERLEKEFMKISTITLGR